MTYARATRPERNANHIQRYRGSTPTGAASAFPTPAEVPRLPAVAARGDVSHLAQLKRLLQSRPSVVAQRTLARALGARAVAAQAAVVQMKWVPLVRESARNHYYDGWGAAMDITSDANLIDTVEDDGPVEEGEQTIEFGKLKNPDEGKIENCRVAFRNWTGKSGDDMSTIFHSGPTSQD